MFMLMLMLLRIAIVMIICTGSIITVASNILRLVNYASAIDYLQGFAKS